MQQSGASASAMDTRSCGLESYEDALKDGPGSVKVNVWPKGPLWSSVNWAKRPSDG